MSANGWFQFAVFSVILLASVRPVGIYLARVLEGERTWLDPVLRPVERLIYRLCGINSDKEMNWREYAFAMLGFSAVTLVVTYAIERLQARLPWNPQGLANVGPDLAWNTAASFTTNTNWQSYTPETTMSYLTQMAGLATHNFWSAAIGHRGSSGPHPRHQAHRIEHHRQLLGGHDPHTTLCAPAGIADRRASDGESGCSAEPARLHHCSYTGAIIPDPDDWTGTGSLAGSHQDVRH
jgi:hypothetical protein